MEAESRFEAPTMSGPDALFTLRNNFQLGAYQAAINEDPASGLSDSETIERDCIVYRSYIALGSYQVRPHLSVRSIQFHKS